MVCPNCQSTDIITVQGENFCIACGHVVPKTATTKKAPTLEELSKVQAKVAGSDEMAVLVGSKKSKNEPAEPLAPKVRGLGPKLKAEAQEVAARVTVQVTPGADQAAAAAAQAELSQAVAKAMAPAAEPKPQPDPEPKPADLKTTADAPATAEPAATAGTNSLIVKHKAPALKSDEKSDEATTNEQDPTAPAKSSIIKAAISRFATPDKSTPTSDPADSQAAPAEDTATVETRPKKTVPKAPPSLKKRKPGRPKAGRLDVPKPAAVAPIQPVASVLSVTEPTPAAAPKLSGGSPRAVTDIRPAAASPAPVTAEVAPIARTTAIDKPKTATNATTPATDVTTTPDSLTAPADAPGFSQPLSVDEPSTGLSGIIRLSLHERIRPISFAWSLIPATFLALIVGGTTLAVTNGRFDAAIAATQKAGWAVWGEGLLILALYYLSHSLINAVIVFGIARRTAHRPVPLARQFGAAINTWLPRLGLDLTATMLVLLVSGLIVGLMVAGSSPWPLPEWAHVTGLFIGFLALVYIIVGLMLAQGLGRVGLTISALSSGSALKLGWRLFWSHFELAGFRALALVLELLLLIPFAAGIIALDHYLPADFNWAIVLGAILLSMIAGALAGAGTAAWWEGAYRHLVEKNYPNEFGRLLGGRAAERPRPLALTTLITALTILIGLSIAWPWLPLH